MESADARLIRRAALWAITGSAVGALTWACLAATTSLLFQERPRVDNWMAGFLVAAYFASFVAIIAVPPYFAVFAQWLLILRRRPGMISSEPRRMLAALILGAPPAVIVTLSFASHSWRFVSEIFLIAVVSCWTGVWLPWRLMNGLQRSLEATRPPRAQAERR